MTKLGWILAVTLALWAGFEGGRVHAARQAREACLDMCEADDEVSIAECSEICNGTASPRW